MQNAPCGRSSVRGSARWNPPGPGELMDKEGAADPRFPDWKRESEFLYRRRQYFSGRGVGVWPGPFSPEAGAAEELVFYDTETTGLSGGAGTVIFLFGAAWCEGRDLAVEQLFLSDFPGETGFPQRRARAAGALSGARLL